MIMIRAMAQTDLPAVLAVAANAFDRDHAQRAQPEFNEMFGAAALRPFFYIAETGGKIVGVSGYGTSWLAYGVYELFWELFWVGVLKENRGRHLGKALVERCLSDLVTVADQVILVTSECEFFKKCGFTVLGPLPTKKGSKDVLMFKQMLGCHNFG
jgi:N-acetylglutamate synthase-like GNAT family acetyltransferase